MSDIELTKRAIKRDEQAFLGIIHLYSAIHFTENHNKNPLKVNFSAYLNYINGDISIELK